MSNLYIFQPYKNRNIPLLKNAYVSQQEAPHESTCSGKKFEM
jgi:hypothetical protein